MNINVTDPTGISFDLTLDSDKRIYCFVGDDSVDKSMLMRTNLREL